MLCSFDDTCADAAAGPFFVFIDGDNGGDLFVRIFFSSTDLATVFVSCTINEVDGDSCFTVVGLTSISGTIPKLIKNHKNMHCHLIGKSSFANIKIQSYQVLDRNLCLAPNHLSRVWKLGLLLYGRTSLKYS